METPINSKWLLCPICKEIPLLTHTIKDKDVYIINKCTSCSKTAQYSIKNYFNQDTSLNINSICFNKCKLHKNENAIALCKKCNCTLLCAQCKETHLNNSHEIEDNDNIKKTFSSEKISQLKEQFKQSFLFYKEQNLKMKELIKEKLTSELNEIVSSIELIEQTYELNENINKELGLFINTIISNYEELYNNNKSFPLFYPVYNLINNTQFTCTHLDLEIDKSNSFRDYVNKLITYYKKTFIVQQPISIRENSICSSSLSHQDFVNTLISLNNNQYASCSNDGTIKIWNIDSNESICTIEIKGEWIYSLCLIHPNLLASCTSGGNIYLWNISDLNNIKHSKLKGHNSSVVKIIKLNKKEQIASCSFDKMIKIWDYQKERTIFTIQDNRDKISSIIQLKDGRIVSGSEIEIRFYNGDSFKCERHMEGVKCSWANSLIELESGEIAVGDENEIKLINVKKFEVHMILKGHLGWVCCLIELFPGCLISGGDDNEIKQWCILNKQMIQSVKGHDDVIKDVICVGGKLITCSDDNRIKVWDF